MAQNVNIKNFKSNRSTVGVLTTDNKHRTTDNNKRWFCVDLGLIDYPAAWKLQTDLVAARINRTIRSDVVLFLEHPPVFTLGRRGGKENLLISESVLEKSGILVIQVERGGNITYHGPGQLIVYLVMDLEAARIGVAKFVEALEEVMLQTAGFWGITAERNPANHGIWVGNKKMGSIGIALRKGVSFHGLALNVNLDLTPFSYIQPCGLQNVRMTSMKRELSAELSMSSVGEILRKQLEAAFGVKLFTKSYFELEGILRNQKHKSTAERF